MSLWLLRSVHWGAGLTGGIDLGRGAGSGVFGRKIAWDVFRSRRKTINRIKRRISNNRLRKI